MSPQNSKSGSNKTPSDPPNIYVGLLFLSVAALITGIVFLTLELNRYDWTAG